LLTELAGGLPIQSIVVTLPSATKYEGCGTNIPGGLKGIRALQLCPAGDCENLFCQILQNHKFLFNFEIQSAFYIEKGKKTVRYRRRQTYIFLYYRFEFKRL